MPARPARELLAILFAHAVGVIAVSYCHHVTPPPTRQGWLLFEFLIALVLWFPARLFFARVFIPALVAQPSAVRRNLVAFATGFGVLLVLWWGSPFEDTLWLHRMSWQQPIRRLLQGAEMLVAGVLMATLGLAVVALDRRLFPATMVEEPSPPARPIRTVDVGLFIALMAVVNAFVVWYVRQEQTVYYWDFMVYWTRTAEFAATLRNQSLGAIGAEFSQSVRTDDYGLTPALAPSVIVALFGDTRLVYVLAIVNLYLASVAVGAWQVVARLVPSTGWFGAAVPLSVTLFCPICWMPLIRGYLDIGGVAIVLAVLGLYLRQPVTQLRLSHVATLVALLTVLALFRRWYCFFIVAFFLLAGADAAIAVVRGGWRQACRGFWALGLVGCGLVGTLSVVATPWVYRVLTTNYADAYTAYKSPDPLADRIGTVLGNCGWGHLVAVAIGLGVLVCYRDTRRAALFVTLLAPIVLVHFLRTQDLGTHHYYLLLPTYLLIPSLAVVRLCGHAPIWARLLIVLGIVAVEGLGMTLMFWPDPPLDRSHVYPLASPLCYPPLVRDDLPELRRLLRYVEEQAVKERGTVAVVSSSPTLNTTTVSQANRSLQEALIDPRRVLPSQEVDRVNGFPTNLFRAAVVIVATPPQTHLTRAEQQVVVIPTELLVNHTGVGAAFEPLPEVFTLSGGVTVRVYRRTRAITGEEFEEFCGRLKAVHPETPSFFTPPDEVKPWLTGPLPDPNG